MSKAALFLIDGFEETEALVTVDILRRGEVEVKTVSLNGSATVEGKHAVKVYADMRFEDIASHSFDMLIIPGGTIAYTEHEGLLKLVKHYDSEKKELGAICAAPAVLGKAGVLRGRRAVCYPGLESWLEGAEVGTDNVVTDGHITTARGPALTLLFAIRLLEILRGEKVAQKVSDDFLLPLLLG